MSKEIILQEALALKILLVRGCKVIFDATLAEIYGITTKRLNEQVRRNIERFPGDFMFRLTRNETQALRSHFAASKGRGGRRYLPYVFTEYGAIQAANVVNSKTAIQAGISVVRAFARLREMVSAHKELAAKLAELERRLSGHDAEIKAIVDIIRQLMNGMNQPQNDEGTCPKKLIGFKP
ncbi:MAG: ORF6N domain-containing protein [Elusimicrobia bacterium]|nr:ORF6N domain-containing protein [Elusimicrobiota bacterium]